MNGLPYYKAYPRDFLEGTIGMDFETKGAYRLLLDLIYMQGGRLPDDPRYISGLLGCSVRAWKKYRQILLNLGKIHAENEIISNFRADKELETLGSFQEKQREKASKSRKNNDLTKAAAKKRLSQPEPEPYNTPISPTGDLLTGVENQSVPQQSKPDPQSDLIEQGWEDFKDIWPKGHPRKETGKTARAKYEAACRGKLKDSDGPVSPQDLNRAARSYIRSVRESQYIKGTVAWLNGAKFIPFLEAMKTAPDAELSSDQKIIAKYRHLNTAPPDDYIASLAGGARH